MYCTAAVAIMIILFYLIELYNSHFSRSILKKRHRQREVFLIVENPKDAERNTSAWRRKYVPNTSRCARCNGRRHLFSYVAIILRKG